MALVPSLRSIIRPPPQLLSLASLFFHKHKFSIPTSSNISSSLKPKTPNPQKHDTLIFKPDERFSAANGGVQDKFESSRTIAAIVTSMGGPPGAVGIVRLSGPKAVDVVGRVFRPLKKRKRKTSWRPTTHVVEYGVVLDAQGNIVDEVF